LENRKGLVYRKLTVSCGSGFFDPVGEMADKIEEEISLRHTNHLYRKFIFLPLRKLLCVLKKLEYFSLMINQNSVLGFSVKKGKWTVARYVVLPFVPI
jgi:hypothetical protein